MAARRQNRFVNQAAAEALVKYGPELAALEQLRQTALGTAKTSVASARSTGADIGRAVRDARPGIGKAYGSALGVAQQQAGIANADLAGLPANSVFRAAAALEQTGLAGRLNESQAAAYTDLGRRAVAAREGTRSAISAAQSKLASDLDQVLSRRVSLAREEGAFTASTAQQLSEQDFKDRQALAIAQGRISQQERNSERSAGIDPNTGKPIPNGPLDPKSPRYRRSGGSRGGTLKAPTSSTTSAVGDAVSWARAVIPHGVSRADAAAALRSGQKPQPVYDTVRIRDKNGKVTGTKQVRRLSNGVPVMTPSVPKLADDAYLQAALDLAYNGYITYKTAQRLHARNLRADAIGKVWWQVPLRRRIPGQAAVRRSPQRRAGNIGRSSTGGRPDTAGNPGI